MTTTAPATTNKPAETMAALEHSISMQKMTTMVRVTPHHIIATISSVRRALAQPRSLPRPKSAVLADNFLQVPMVHYFRALGTSISRIKDMMLL
jgi:hypothetical protein